MEPFLLIVCTHAIVTAASICGEYGGIHQSFQHIVRFFNVTTAVYFIVTAAVYWGLTSKLRLAANLSA